MASNVEQFKKGHAGFNSRDFDAVADLLADGFVYHDHSRGIEFRGRDEFKAFMSEWVKIYSDCRIENPAYIDGGNKVVAQFTARGTNDGPFGQLPPTNKQVTMDMCEIMQFDDQGKIVAGDIYYDQLSMLMQLGHVQPRPAEQAAAPQPQP